MFLFLMLLNYKMLQSIVITLMKKIPNRHRWEFHVKRKRKKRGKETSEGRN